MDHATTELRDRWLAGEFSASETIASRMGTDTLIDFATRGLAACCNAVPSPPPEVLQVVEIGRDPALWRLAHQAFDSVRKLVLEAEQQRAEPNDLRFVLLFVAENSARAIYNASMPSDPFDDDSGAWLVHTLSQFIQAMPSSTGIELASAIAKIAKLV